MSFYTLVPTSNTIEHLQNKKPCWATANNKPIKNMYKRPYFDLLHPFVKATDIKRAVVLREPKPVEKTVIILQTI